MSFLPRAEHPRLIDGLTGAPHRVRMLGRLAAVAAAVVLLGCSGSPNAQIDGRQPPAEDAAPSPDAGPSPDDAAATPSDALPTLDAASDAPAVDPRIYVSPTGSDTADGSRAHPLASIAAAARAASTGAHHVLVCGSYTAPLALGAEANGVTISGGFDCATWQPGGVTTVAPVSGYALTIDGATGVTIEDVRFAAADAKDGSSVSAYIARSSGVTLRRVTAIGGKGAPGRSGTTPSAALPPAIPGANAAAAPFSTGGQGPTLHCPYGGDSVGGNGGTGQSAGNVGQPLIAENAGQTGNACTIGTRGQDGAPSDNGPGARTSGAWLSDAWRPSGGLPGNGGHTGQGGGGGGGGAGPGNGGGSGGTGGCGGDGGGAGEGGGASFGLVIDHAAVRLESCALVSGQAGDGGAGAPGQAGELGAGPGTAGGSGCHGGEGGNGSTGAAGGGGAGGVSAALVFSGTSPTSDGLTTFTAGTAGVRGLGGAPGANDGASGVVKTTLVLL